MRFVLPLLATVAASCAGPVAETLPRLAPLSPAAAEKAFVLREGFRLSLAACEPEVVDPIALSFARDGRLLVAEMRDYSERRAEKLSRIRCLRDADGDGRFETSTVFMDGLAWATGVVAWKDGAFITATPDLWWARDADGDGVAEERRVVFTGFGSGAARLNVQALVNSLSIHPVTGRIYGATAGNGGSVRRVLDGQPQGDAVNVNGADFSFDPETLDFRAESGTAQYGLTFDGWGNRFVCSNSRHLVWVAYDRNLLAPGGAFPPPGVLVDVATDGPAAEVFRLSPEEPWRVVRTRWRASGLMPGLIEGGGRASGYFTSATGIHISRGSVCPGDAFIADVGSNLVHRKRLAWSLTGPRGERAEDEQQREFLASRDTWFRPVSFASGPDGALYIADMYREFIEHPDSLPPQLKSQMDLNSGNDRGRIWRIVPEKPPALSASAAPPRGSLPDDILRTRTLPPAERLAALTAHWNSTASSPLHRGLILSTLTKAEVPEFFRAVAPAGATPAMKLAAELRVKPAEPLLAQARRLRREGSTAERLAALECLHLAGESAWDPAPGDALEVEILRLRYQPAAAEHLLTAQWTKSPAALRSAALDLLVVSPSGRAALVRAIAAKWVPSSELSALQADALRKDAATRAEATALLPPPPADRTAEIAKRQPALALTGDAQKGRAHFLARCAACHRDGAEGFAVGPDRTTFTNKGAPTLLVAILDPSREIAGQFGLVIVKPQPGKGTEAAGISLREDATGITLRQPGGAEQTFARENILSIERPAQSFMPVGIEAGMSDQDLADLLTFLMQK